ncbi:unnamed protein product, partial [Prorocentrum cordatum]
RARRRTAGPSARGWCATRTTRALQTRGPKGRVQGHVRGSVGGNVSGCASGTDDDWSTGGDNGSVHEGRWASLAPWPWAATSDEAAADAARLALALEPRGATMGPSAGESPLLLGLSRAPRPAAAKPTPPASAGTARAAGRLLALRQAAREDRPRGLLHQSPGRTVGFQLLVASRIVQNPAPAIFLLVFCSHAWTAGHARVLTLSCCPLPIGRSALSIFLLMSCCRVSVAGRRLALLHVIMYLLQLATGKQTVCSQRHE